MSKSKKENVLNSLFTHCRSPLNSSSDVFDHMVKDLALIGVKEIREEAVDIIRKYKSTGKNLEATVYALHDLFYPAVNSVTNQTIFDFDETT